MTVSSTYHIWLCSIATDRVLVDKQDVDKVLVDKQDVDKVLVDKQEDTEMFQEKIMSLTLQLMKREEKIS